MANPWPESSGDFWIFFSVSEMFSLAAVLVAYPPMPAIPTTATLSLLLADWPGLPIEKLGNAVDAADIVTVLRNLRRLNSFIMDDVGLVVG